MRCASPAAVVLMLLGLSVQLARYGAADDATDYHEAARSVIEAIPLSVGDWVGQTQDVPPSARDLLKPNAMKGVRYINQRTGRQASMVVVQCEDARDMGGHYPPACYPSAGYRESEPRVERGIEIRPGLVLPVTEYTFSIDGADGPVETTIYGFFVLPGVGPLRELARVRRAASDYRARMFGAAQVQVLISSVVPPAERDGIFRELAGMLADLGVLETLSGGRGPGPEEGDQS